MIARPTKPLPYAEVLLEAIEEDVGIPYWLVKAAGLLDTLRADQGIDCPTFAALLRDLAAYYDGEVRFWPLPEPEVH